MEAPILFDEGATVELALRQAHAFGLERLDAQLILSHLLKRDRTWLMAHPEQSLGGTEASEFAALCRRRHGGEPVAYLVGAWAFHGLRLEVNPAVLIPRPETEGLVDWALELFAEATAVSAPARVIDLGTGSGAIALAMKARRPQAQVTATDASAAALALATRNAAQLGLEVSFRQGDWWAAVAGQTYALALANPPYIAADDVHLRGLEHEPQLALTPGGDGLDALRQIVAGAPRHLMPGGWLLLEHGWDQARAVRDLLDGHHFEAVASRRDWAGHERYTGGRLTVAPKAENNAD